jgi:hypothetical protein
MINSYARHTGLCNKSALIVSLQGHKGPADDTSMKYRQFRRSRAPICPADSDAG